MSTRKVTARQAGSAVARQSLRQFDREIAAMDKQAAEEEKLLHTSWVEVPELVERPAEIKTVSFEMGGKQYQTRSSWELLG